MEFVPKLIEQEPCRQYASTWLPSRSTPSEAGILTLAGILWMAMKGVRPPGAPNQT